MKSIKYVLVLIIFALLYYFFFNKPVNQNTVKLSIGGDLQSTVKTNKNIESTKKVKKLAAKNADQEKPISQERAKRLDKEKSYLEAYRDYKFILGCIPILQKLKSSQGFLALLTQSKNPIQNFIDERKIIFDKEPSDLLVDYYQKHMEKCQSFTEGDSRNHFLIIEEYKTNYELITPVTDEEIYLSQALEINDRILESKGNIYKHKMGADILTPEEKKKRQKQTLALTNELTLVMMNTDSEQGMSEEKIAAMTKLVKQMQQTIMPNADVMTDEIKELQLEIQNGQLELNDFFKLHQTPDVFLIFADTLLSNTNGRNFINDELNEILGIFDERYIEILNEVIVPLVACSLDYPCDAESDIAVEFCVQIYKDNEQSCGKNLEDYFLDNYLSKNQLIDVYNYLNYLLNKYA